MQGLNFKFQNALQQGPAIQWEREGLMPEWRGRVQCKASSSVPVLRRKRLPPELAMKIEDRGTMNQSPAFPFHSSYQDLKARNKNLLKRSHQEKYRQKCLRMNRIAKTIVFENTALADEIARLEEKFIRAKDERRFLLKRMLQLQALSEDCPTPSHNTNLPVTYGISEMGVVNEGTLDMCLSSVDDSVCKQLRKDKREKGKEIKLESK
ncbi:transforming growth factor beta regulator 1 [Bombina bombina]|uniref:transforming growth factor beta regulator 1 n=1 Tax=Bombina bombina TaxID=8345 RepID=UPI00235B1378|nr:transforming growth factor beta regulator 1 [Bombina bombina]